MKLLTTPLKDYRFVWPLILLVVIYVMIFKVIPGFGVTVDVLHISTLLASVLAGLTVLLTTVLVSYNTKKKVKTEGSLLGLGVVVASAVILNQTFLYIGSGVLSNESIYVAISYVMSVLVSAVPLILRTTANSTLRFIIYTALAIIAIVALGASLKTSWHHLNPDGVSYFSIAEHYANGRIQEAINAYWSPFLSWLIVPFIWLGLEANTGYRIIVVLTSVLIVLGQYTILRNLLPKKGQYSSIIIYGALVVSSLFLISVIHGGLITPDLLTLAWAVWFFAIYSSTLHAGKLLGNGWLRWSVALGIFGAFGFYIKGFLLPFFVAGLLAMAVMQLWLQNKSKRRPVAAIIISTGVTILLIVPWTVALKHKYGTWMTGSSSKYNLSWVGPESVRHPILNKIIEPPHKYAVGAWEDPTDHPYVRWSPLQSMNDLQHHMFINMNNNVQKVVDYMASWSAASLLSVFVGVLIVPLWVNRRGMVSDRRLQSVVILSVLSLIYIGGYLVVHLVGGDRYIWPVLGMNMLLIALLSSYLLEKTKKTERAVILFMFMFLISTQFVGLYVNNRLKSNLKDRDSTGYKSLSLAYSTTVPPGSRVASNSLALGLYTSYALDLKFYGVVRSEDSKHEKKEVLTRLQENDIEYFFCFKTIETCGLDKDKLVWESNNRLNKVFEVKHNDK